MHVFSWTADTGRKNLARAPFDAAGTILSIQKRIAYPGTRQNIFTTLGKPAACSPRFARINSDFYNKYIRRFVPANYTDRRSLRDCFESDIFY